MVSGVAPLVGAWIEILRSDPADTRTVVAPLVGAWIEIFSKVLQSSPAEDVAPLVGAWIEI